MNGGGWAMPGEILNVPVGRAKDLSANGLVLLSFKGAEGSGMQTKPAREVTTKPARAPNTRPRPEPHTAKSPPAQTKGGTDADPNA